MLRSLRMLRFRTLVPVGLSLSLLVLAAAPSGANEPSATADDPDAPVSFYRQVLPVLQRKCQGCHQPAKAQGQLVLTSYETLLAGGRMAGPGVEPGEPEASALIEYIEGDEPLMPPTGPAMTPEEVVLVARWIAEGAHDDTPPLARDTIDADHPPVYTVAPLTTALAFSPDGETLAISGYREVLLHRADGSGLVARLVGEAQRIETLVYSPDGTLLAAVGGSPGRFGEVQFWDPWTHQLRGAARSTYDTLYGGAFSPDGARFAFGCADNTGRVIDVDTGEEVLKIDHHTDWVFGTTFSHEGNHLITLGRDGALKLTEADTGSFIDDIGKNYGELKVLARHPRDDKVVIGGEERVPRLYQIFRTQARDMNYTDFNLLRAFEPQPGPISAVAFRPDGEAIAVGGSGGEVRIYHIEDGQRLQTLPGHQGGIFALAFSPDGRRVASGGFDGNVRIFDVASGNLIASFVPVPISAEVVAQADE